MALTSVTISRESLDNLLRRAKYDVKNTVPTGQNTIRLVTTQEWEDLQAKALEYGRLRQALLDGGIDMSTLEVLVKGEASLSNNAADAPFANNAANQFSAQAPEFKPQHPSHNHQHALSQQTQYLNGRSVRSSDPSRSRTSSHTSFSLEEKQESSYEDYEESKPYTNDHGRRSIVLEGISDVTMLQDITNVIRGGMILNMFVRPRERMAHVTFVDSSAAEAFVYYARKNGIYIRNKRIDVGWDGNQYYLGSHIAYRIFKTGATRNLLIRNAKTDMTFITICNDLDHIHRLEVVAIKSEGSDIVVSLNSVNNAITAKACMSSRFRYKGTRIEFAPDECVQDLPQVKPRKSTHQDTQPKTIPIQNRFQMLSFDGNDDEDEGDYEDSLANEYATLDDKMRVNLKWKSQAVVA